MILLTSYFMNDFNCFLSSILSINIVSLKKFSAKLHGHDNHAIHIYLIVSSFEFISIVKSIMISLQETKILSKIKHLFTEMDSRT